MRWRDAPSRGACNDGRRRRRWRDHRSRRCRNDGRRRWRRRRLRRRRVLEQLPGGALGQVGRAGNQGGRRGRRRQLHLERRQVVGRDAGEQRREPHLPGRQRAHHPRPGRHGHQAVGGQRDRGRRPGRRLRPADRGSRRAVRDVRQRQDRRDGGGGRPRRRVRGQLRDHQGQLRRRQRGLPPRRATSTPASRRKARAATRSRSSARPTPTTGTLPSPRPRWSSSSRRTTTRSMPSCRRTTGWPAASSPPSRPRVSPARFRSLARTAIRRRSTGSPSARRRSTSGRTPACSARRPVRRRPQLCANPDVAAVSDTAPFTTPGGIEVSSILLEPHPDHPGQPRRRARCRMDRRGDALPGRRSRLGACLRLIPENVVRTRPAPSRRVGRVRAR